jgi:hypothetical protein
MSRILRRPMFRGGKVIDSRGTGITSGLMDGGRVGYKDAGSVLGSDLYKPSDFSKFINQNFASGRKTEGFSPAFLNQMFDSKGNLKEDFTYENIFSGNLDKEKPKSMFEDNILEFSDVGIAGDKAERISPNNRKFANLLKTDVLSKLEESGKYSYDDMPRPGGADAATFGKKDPPDSPNPNDPNNNDEQVTEVDAKTLMKENAELFKELLGEGNKKKLKDARIEDVSDYLLKFFEGSQQEGATVGSSAANVASFATAKPSKTELAKQAIDKSDQTAMALAINDYIAGKRSKEQIDLMEKKLGANFAQQIALIDYKNKKETFVDLVGELGKGMSNARAIASAVQKAFGKVPTALNEKQAGANLLNKENVGEYFIFPDGTVKTVIESGDGKLIEDIIYSPSGITLES